MGLIPAYRLTVNGVDISKKIGGRLSSVSVTIESAHQSDELSIILSDADRTRPIIKPPTGAVIAFALGYEGDLVAQGTYVVSALEGSGGASQAFVFGIRARAAPYTQTPDGATGLQTQKTRSWKRGTSIGDMVTKMAREHGMTAAVSHALNTVALSHYDQTNESDMSFLTRLARHYDAVAKPANGKLLFVSRGQSQTASGQKLAVLNLTQSDVTSWHWDEDKVLTPGTVVALYHATGRGQTRALAIGTGDPVRRIKRHFRNADDARAAATAEMARRARGAMRLHLAMPGNARIAAETTVKLDESFPHGAHGLWLVKRVMHMLTVDTGFTTELDCERPNDDPTVAAHLNQQISDTALNPS